MYEHGKIAMQVISRSVKAPIIRTRAISDGILTDKWPLQECECPDHAESTSITIIIMYPSLPTPPLIVYVYRRLTGNPHRAMRAKHTILLCQTRARNLCNQMSIIGATALQQDVL